MKVILMSDVSSVGKKYDIAEVAPGYARNFLFPKGIAEAVTKGNAKKIADIQKRKEVEKKSQEESLLKVFKGIMDAKIEFTRKANEQGSLFAGVTAEEIALELGKLLGVEIRPELMNLEKPIKHVGDTELTVELRDKRAMFTVTVKAEAEETEGEDA